MPPLVELENVVKFYGPTQALGPLSLSLPEGSVGILGPNGSGKSTLLRLLLGVLRPTSGTVRVMGEEAGTRNLRTRLGYSPEGDSYFPDLTGVEAVAFAGRLVGMHRADALQRAHQVLDYVELGEARYRLVAKYSTGMRQRLKLAQSLVHDPDVLILDEPTEGVDPEARVRILELIQELHKEHGLQVLVCTHLLNDVERLTDYALVLNQGQSAGQGKLADLKAAPSKGYLVRVNGPWDALTRRLSAEGITWEPMAPNLRVNSDDPRRILKVVEESGLVVRHLAPLELSLGEAFERAVGGTPNA